MAAEIGIGSKSGRCSESWSSVLTCACLVRNATILGMNSLELWPPQSHSGSCTRFTNRRQSKTNCTHHINEWILHLVNKQSLSPYHALAHLPILAWILKYIHRNTNHSSPCASEPRGYASSSLWNIASKVSWRECVEYNQNLNTELVQSRSTKSPNAESRLQVDAACRIDSGMYLPFAARTIDK